MANKGNNPSPRGGNPALKGGNPSDDTSRLPHIIRALARQAANDEQVNYTPLYDDLFRGAFDFNATMIKMLVYTKTKNTSDKAAYYRLYSNLGRMIDALKILQIDAEEKYLSLPDRQP